MGKEDALRMAAALAEAPLPARLVTDDPASLRGEPGVRLDPDHELWNGGSVELEPGLRRRLASEPLPGALAEALVRRFSDFFCQYFVWPPPEMLMNARAVEPHVEPVLALARSLEMFEQIATIQNQRALFKAWYSGRTAQSLEHEEEAVAAYRRTREPHPGMLGMLLTGLATFQRPAQARESLLEAESLLVPLVGRKSIEPFLLYCQLAHACGAAGDRAGERRARAEAEAIADRIDGRRLRPHVKGTLSWAQWHVQHYFGL